jgi:hypothetical protein
MLVSSIDILFLNAGEVVALSSMKSWITNMMIMVIVPRRQSFTYLVLSREAPSALHEVVQNGNHIHFEVLGILGLGT